ncbi:sensor histidine kinase [Algoriphagus sediminis]|uniref:histidine kinase n=1 Tax=Algoriphagus sediminis TaxID=3057113 RepID=A0ABT7Y809_9BACT|nr:histidine kinase N-terminal 7TM domain-containing protein [Algoriphagus sediminis]MDN3202590.1 histidine kinase N-terminal 7TM domain-containing protein [Algoriphagus sediminis]
MELSFNPFSLILLLSGSIVGLLCGYIAFLLKGLVRWLALTMLCIAIWGVFYGLELASQNISDMIFWGKLQYIGIALAPAAWLYFTLKYTDYKLQRNRPLVYSLLLIPIVTIILVWTNESHHWHYISIGLNESGPIPLLKLENGPWYFVNVAYSYLVFSLGILVLWKRFRFADPLHRAQTRLILFAGIFPLFFNLLYQTGIFIPYDGIDLTPYAFLFTYIIVGIAILKFNLFSIKPIARDKVVEAITKGVLVLDEKNLVVDFNPAMESFNPREVELMRTFDSQRIFKDQPEILALIRNKDHTSIQTQIKRGDKEMILAIESIPLEDKNSSLTGKVLIFDDITRQIETRQRLESQANELQQLNDLKDKFFSIISHDLKGPVFGVTELIHLTQTGMISQEEFFEMLPEVSKNMTNVSVLLENLLAWSSSQLRGEQRFPEDFNTLKSLKSQAELLSRIANEKEVEIEILTEEDIYVFADKNMIDLVVRNLINNGIKFSKPKTKIELTAELEGDKVKICVQDFGIGISEDNLEKLKSGVSFTTKGESNETGTGLGLVLVREYLKKNDGELTVTSAPGEGSKFCVTLPSSEKNKVSPILTELKNS